MSGFCSTHRHDLLNAIKRKGMGGYVTYSADLARERAHRWLVGALRNSDDFDPHVVATLEIYSKAQSLNLPGHACALCECEMLGSGMAGMWIDNVTDAMVMVCETSGLKRD